MEYVAFLPDGTMRTGMIDPAYVATFKRQAVRDVTRPSHHEYPGKPMIPYRYQVTDPACAGVWDTDDLLGIDAWTRLMSTDELIPPPSTHIRPRGSEDARRDLRNADSPIGMHEANMRQFRTATAIVRAYHALMEDNLTLHADDDAAAYSAFQNASATLRIEAGNLGWPMDGNGEPLPECKDEL